MIQVAQILFILSVLVVLHEFGHYIAAKIFKVRVEKFYLFMDAGFSLVKKKIGDTEWGIGWLPLGGYVKLAGMIDESMDTDQMNEEMQPWEFRSKPAWQRLIIMLGGIIVNVLLAWLIYTVMYTTVGKKYVDTSVLQENGLQFGEVGQNAGFRNGDKIKANVALENKPQIVFFLANSTHLPTKIRELSPHSLIVGIGRKFITTSKGDIAFEYTRNRVRLVISRQVLTRRSPKLNSQISRLRSVVEIVRRN